MKRTLISWRLNDPADEWRQRWTKVHLVSVHAEDLTACHLEIPRYPYDVARDEWIPTARPRCKRCLAASE